MKKTLMFLVLSGLIAGSAQAQGVQVRKVFAHNIPNYVENLSIDTLNGKPVVIADLGPGDMSGAKSRLVVFDSTGEKLSVEGGWSGWPPWTRRVSKNGRYFASRQAGGDWKAMDKRGNRLHVFPGASVVQIVQVSEDGERWLGLVRRLPGKNYDPVHQPHVFRNVESDPTNKLILFNKQGRSLTQIAAPGLSLAEFSPKDNWLFIRYKHITGRKYPLACYDKNGNRKWYMDDRFTFPLFRADSLNNLCVLEWREGKTYGLAFYSPMGQEQGFVPLIEVPNKIQFAACGLELTRDGKFAVFNGDKYGLFYVQKSPPQVLWTWKQEAFPTGRLISDFAISRWGDYIVADVNDVSRREGHIYLFDRSGIVIWKNSDLQGAIAHLSFGFDNYFAAHTGNAEVTLFEIKP